MSCDVSIVIPVYWNGKSVQKTYAVLWNEVIRKFSAQKFEIIFVDDGSGDDSLAQLMAVKNENKNSVPIKIVKLARNFGQVPAILAGYAVAKGKCVINVAADLQDPPELLVKMIQAFFRGEAKVIAGARNSRDDGMVAEFLSKVAYSILRKLCFAALPSGGFDVCLLEQGVKDLILADKSSSPFWQGQILWLGFPILFIPYDRLARVGGTSKWTLGKRVKYLYDGIFSYSYQPIRYISALGVGVAGLGFLYAAVILVARLLGYIVIPGWAPIMIVILVLFGMQMIMLGVIGEYLWRTFERVSARPTYIVDKLID